jgi:mannose-6-phosphate isomerase class I
MLDNLFKRIFLVVPKIIEQPTWGGKYILQYKNWLGKGLFKNKNLKIGQSYELSSQSKLRTDITSSDNPSFTGERGYSMEPDKIYYQGDKSKLISLKSLIRKNPEAILGKKVLSLYGQQPGILIKFTQAKGNSFQLHVQEKDESERWKTKPESWYYFEPGLLTLGVKQDIDWQKYKDCCLEIEREMNQLSQQAKAKKLNLKNAQKQAQKLVKKHNPWQYVNLLKVKKDELVDLSQCGLHHSWEEDEKNYPLGNIVYELCKDVMDPVSTVRCFDRGKIKKDGSVRKVNIKDYFQFIDRSERTNNPQNHLFQGKKLFSNKNILVLSLMKSKYYCLEKFLLNGSYKGESSQTKDSFHHIFVQKGAVSVKTLKSEIKLTQGHSCFIPAALGEYSLTPEVKNVELLKTFVC